EVTAFMRNLLLLANMFRENVWAKSASTDSNFLLFTKAFMLVTNGLIHNRFEKRSSVILKPFNSNLCGKIYYFFFSSNRFAKAISVVKPIVLMVVNVANSKGSVLVFFVLFG